MSEAIQKNNEATAKRNLLIEMHNDSIVAEELEFIDEEDNDLNQSFIQRVYRREMLYKQSKGKLCCTILHYLWADIKKKPKNFCIGITTVVLVVCFITALKSLIDVAPVAFLKVGQGQAGAVDITLVSDYPSFLKNADYNEYK